ncbi:ABC-transporter [Coprinopsis marcescibilis]|uniref:ABC-transporter n=1 Tax=Coprinopsis marcescibilis TaxID=230819 RepID=A0A5C3L1F1_COPMA|nr:ABC-transporter [Coprinopsis marcescibilis]
MASVPVSVADVETITLNDQTSRYGSSRGQHPTDDVVTRAEADFSALSRQLSRSSAKRLPKHASGDELEKGAQESEQFDLREYLMSSNDANQRAGIKHKKVGVVWEDLQVEVPESISNKIFVPTLATETLMFFLMPVLSLMGLIRSLLPLKPKQIKTEPVVHRASGVLKPGEMCLVLGCPGAGCTTFLKVIANQREEFAKVDGDVLYAGISADEMQKYYKGEVVYNQEDDVHIPTLTVGQTLQFALSTKTPGPNGRLPGISKEQFNSEVEDTLLRMLNIPHSKNTLVGDAFVRGVSGGERKRVSIGEMMATRARVQSWDNSTRGLDASTALDFVRSLRVMTDVLGQTTFVTLYQASESIYQLFDKVLLIDGGRQVFYGPPAEARAYFENLGYKSLPRQTTADYLTGCTDVNERQYAPGRSTNNTPSTPEALEQAFRQSRFGKENNDAVGKYKLYMETEKADQEAFRAAVAADKKRGVSASSPYTLGFSGQVWALTKRQFQMRLQNSFQLRSSFFFAIVLSLITGAAFYDQPLSSSGAFTRGSVIFMALLTTCLDAFTEMPSQMMGRPVLRKQTEYGLYRPSVISLANLLADLPFSAIRVLIYNVPVYFLSGLHRSAGAFFTFHLFNYVAFLSMQALFRLFGFICFDPNSAFRLAVFCIPNFVQYCGYTIPVLDMKRWLFWIYYINPLSYAWQACMTNEFMRIAFPCDGASVIPRNGLGITKFPTDLGLNQACTVFGAKAGNVLIQGVDYLRVGYEIDASDIWRRNLPVLIGFFLFFQALQIFALEFYPQYGYMPSFRIWAPENDEIRGLNQAQVERRQRKDIAKEKEEAFGRNRTKVNTSHSGRALTWESLNYTVPVPGGQRRLLNDIYGYVKPGTLTALMGASGAGKTTCLDVLAQRKNIGVITGDVLVNGRPLPLDFARGTAYAEQMDVHEMTATVREALRFSAYLRQPASVPKEEKDAYVEDLIELLELQNLTEALVFSLSVEARKRLTIGVELASKPELLLFLDEPTSGLDAQSAWNLVRFLRQLADQGQAILCTIHQPSSLLFESFDRLLLLERGGETVYFGEIGEDSRVIREYFADHGAVCPPDANPAEYMLEAIGAGVTPRIGDKDWKDVWLESAEFKQVLREIEEIKTEGLRRPEPNKGDVTTYATSFSYQLRIVGWRSMLALWRTPNSIFTRLYSSAFISLFISLSFLQLGNSVRDMQYRLFSIFWLVVLPSITLAQAIPAFIMARGTFIRESSGQIYSPYVFAIAQLYGEIPYSILCGFLYWVLMVYPTGFGQGDAGVNGTGFQLLIAIFMVFFGVSLGQFIGALSPSFEVGLLTIPTINTVLSLFSGVTIPYPVLQSFWHWLYEVSPYTRTLAAMLSTELTGLTIRCNMDEFAIFSPPSGESCASWAQEFVDVFGGYLDNPNDTSACRYCQFKVGDEFFLPLNIRYSNRWRDAFILFSFIVFNIIGTVVASRLLRYAKR